MENYKLTIGDVIVITYLLPFLLFSILLVLGDKLIEKLSKQN